jgi:hypothetical protein
MREFSIVDIFFTIWPFVFTGLTRKDRRTDDGENLGVKTLCDDTVQ